MSNIKFFFCFLLIFNVYQCNSSMVKIANDKNQNREQSLGVFANQLNYSRTSKRIKELLIERFGKDLGILIYEFVLANYNSNYNIDTKNFFLYCTCQGKFSSPSPDEPINYDYIRLHKKTDEHKKGEAIKSEKMVKWRKIKGFE